MLIYLHMFVIIFIYIYLLTEKQFLFLPTKCINKYLKNVILKAHQVIGFTRVPTDLHLALLLLQGESVLRCSWFQPNPSSCEGVLLPPCGHIWLLHQSGHPSQCKTLQCFSHNHHHHCSHFQGFPCSSVVKNLPAMQETQVPLLGRFPGEGNSNPCQYSCLESPMTEEPGRLHTVLWGCKSRI